jgi:hypothetical protein
MLQFKLIAIAVVALAIGGLIWKEHRATRRAQAAEAKVETLQASLAAAEANRKIEQDDRRRADESAKSLEAELASIRNAPRITGVLICPRVPSPSGQSRPTAVADDSSTERVEGVPSEDIAGIDVSAGLDEYATNCAATAATLSALQQWEQARTH